MLPQKKNGFSDDEIGSADETSIHWKCLPSKILAEEIHP